MKSNKGITLIALIVTIIVLIILAGIAIMMLRGDNGILNRASEAKYQNIISGFEEQMKIGHLAVRTTISAKMVSTPGYIATKDADTLKYLADQVANGLGVTATTGASGNISTKDYTVEYYLDDPGTTQNNGDGYIVIWYTDNALRSSLPYRTDAERAAFVSGNALLTESANTTNLSRNQFTLAAVIHVTNYNCTLSGVYATSTTDGNNDRNLVKFTGTTNGKDNSTDATKVAHLYDASMVLADN